VGPLGNDRGQPSRTAVEAGRARRHRSPAGLNSGTVSVAGCLARRAPASESGVARRSCSQCSESGVAMADSDLILVPLVLTTVRTRLLPFLP
jgi:hypothetical protein